jgi:hypothetical protein
VNVIDRLLRGQRAARASKDERIVAEYDVKRRIDDLIRYLECLALEHNNHAEEVEARQQ